MKSSITIGMDMGDQKHNICQLSEAGEVIETAAIANTAPAIKDYFEGIKPSLVALEAGTHSGWVSRVLEELGHEVVVGNPRKLRAIWDSDEKDDERDAEMLARIARFDRKLLYPIAHRGAKVHADLAVIKARDMLVKSRSMMIAHCRGSVKSLGHRLTSCSADCFHKQLAEELPEELKSALEPMMKSIEELTKRIRHYDRQITKLSVEVYPETRKLRAVSGVGPITALAYVLTLEESTRFTKSRAVGAYLGLVPRRDKSGQTDKQLPITKAGDSYLRRLLAGGAQYILGPFGPDCELRRFGLKLAARGGKNAKRRAVVAVARKLAVLLHKLWAADVAYDPFYSQSLKKKKAA